MSASKTVVITGANAGIGLATAQGLAEKGFQIITICRNKGKGEETVAAIKAANPDTSIENFVADLSDLESVTNTATEILAKYPVIDRLINNAGYYPAAIEYIGDIEKTLFASHIGHMLLTQLLLPALERSPEGRIINVSSALHSGGRFERFFKRTQNLTAGEAYADAKLANILFTMALAKRVPKTVTTFSLHPGVVNTNFAKNTPGFFSVVINILRPLFLAPAKGAATTIYLADADTDLVRPHHGRYFVKKLPAKTSNSDLTSQNANELWNRSQEILKKHLEKTELAR
jgi:retinol dehydrogenase-12